MTTGTISYKDRRTLHRSNVRSSLRESIVDLVIFQEVNLEIKESNQEQQASNM